MIVLVYLIVLLRELLVFSFVIIILIHGMHTFQNFHIIRV